MNCKLISILLNKWGLAHIRNASGHWSSIGNIWLYGGDVNDKEQRRVEGFRMKWPQRIDSRVEDPTSN